jgi:RimJ/RimL family protein N-acetyltransferase
VTAPVVLRIAATPTAPALVLRPWSLAEAAPLVEVFRDAAMRRWTSHIVENETDGTRWVRSQQQSWASGDRFSFAVFEAQPEGLPGRLLGSVVLKGIAPGGPAAEVGYWTAPHARGRGVASRAVEALADWAFGTFEADGLERLELLHQVDNQASCRVAQKSGFDVHRVLPAAPPGFPRAGHLHVALSRAGRAR